MVVALLLVLLIQRQARRVQKAGLLVQFALNDPQIDRLLVLVKIKRELIDVRQLIAFFVHCKIVRVAFKYHLFGGRRNLNDPGR